MTQENINIGLLGPSKMPMVMKHQVYWVRWNTYKTKYCSRCAYRRCCTKRVTQPATCHLHHLLSTGSQQLTFVTTWLQQVELAENHTCKSRESINCKKPLPSTQRFHRWTNRVQRIWIHLYHHIPNTSTTTLSLDFMVSAAHFSMLLRQPIWRRSGLRGVQYEQHIKTCKKN